MEQHRPRTARSRPAPSSPAPAPETATGRLPRPARRGPAGGAHRAGAGRPGARRGRPRARLTGLGSGLLAAVVMAAAGALHASPAMYGGTFLLIGVLSATYVRATELLSAPAAAPLAFLAGLPFLNKGDPGLAGQLFGIFSALAMQAPWLFAGTAAAVLVAAVRGTAQAVRRARANRARRRR